MLLPQVLQFLGVLRPDLHVAARHKAVIECAPQLVSLLKDAKTDAQKTAASDEFGRIVQKRADELLLKVITEQR
jgi:hypothetical protein